MNTTLELNIYWKRNNRGCMVFKRNGMLYRINNLVEALQFLGRMEQLRKSIETSASLNCSYALQDHRGKKWLLRCKHENGAVVFSIWLEVKCSVENPYVVFCWTGQAIEFCKSVKDFTLQCGNKYVFL